MTKGSFCYRCGKYDTTFNYEKVHGADAEAEYWKCHSCGLSFGISITGPDAGRFRKSAIAEIRFWNVPGLTRLIWMPQGRRVLYSP